ncbi:DgyrCDS8916 [Dimorphilus gyrociliatus]|uniref:COP9 signalosome complex subunit 8 n=1 Tax=Dimorphilus gyrociliatus TaxID=2664684 RepID=A0A7I8VVH2_9ANNE|nr:DgyrCDS8916 [Dimorphilus gyrociliatus]
MATGEGCTTNFQRLLAELEQNELEHPNENNEQNYSLLIALYMLENDLNNARYTWKRAAVCSPASSSELQQVWNCGKRLWEKDYQGFYKALNFNWSERLKPVMFELEGRIRQKMLDLVAFAYTSVSLTDLSAFFGLPENEAVDMVQKLGWAYNQETRMLSPVCRDKSSVAGPSTNDHLERLTKFVNFLETMN